MTDKAVPVYLLKTRSTPHDNYFTHFASLPRHYSPIFIPVLDTNFPESAITHVTHLLDTHALDPTHPSRIYSGLIFTSQRAVDAFALALSHARTCSIAQPPVYVVGPATGTSVRALRLRDVRGEGSGNGAALAAHIADVHEVRSAPLLFLVGEVRRDVIPRVLGALPEGRKVEVEEIVVYETGEREGFGKVFEECARDEGWVVVFSPQGVRQMLEVRGRRKRLRIAVIGPTTRDCLKAFGVEPDVCAEMPSPEGVAKGIEEWMNEHGSC